MRWFESWLYIQEQWIHDVGDTRCHAPTNGSQWWNNDGSGNISFRTFPPVFIYNGQSIESPQYFLQEGFTNFCTTIHGCLLKTLTLS